MIQRRESRDSEPRHPAAQDALELRAGHGRDGPEPHRDVAGKNLCSPRERHFLIENTAITDPTRPRSCGRGSCEK